MRDDTIRWTTSGIVVLAVFAIGVWLVDTWSHRVIVSAMPSQADALAIEIAPTPQAPKAVMTEREAGPSSDAQHAAVAKPRRQRVVPLSAAASPDALPAQPPAEAPAPTQSTSASVSADEHTTAPPAVAAPSGDRYAAASSAAAEGAQIMANWQSTVLGYLKRYRRYPRQSERSHEEGVSWVRFAVDRQGRVGTASIEVSSGHEALDEEALRTVQRASPLPAPPESLPGDPVMVLVPVNFFLKGA